jgi:hypothetical protein
LYWGPENGAKACFRPHSSVVEHFLGKEEVTGSNPVVGSTRKSMSKEY